MRKRTNVKLLASKDSASIARYSPEVEAGEIKTSLLVMLKNHYRTDETGTWPCELGKQIEFAKMIVHYTNIGSVAHQEQLNALLNYAQNSPPHGASDDTIGDESYRALRTLYDASKVFLKAITDAERAVAKDMGLLAQGIKAR